MALPRLHDPFEAGGDRSVTEFAVSTGAGRVPAALWLPRDAGAAPVVLLGHGGSGSKRSARIARLADRFTRNRFAALAIDGPYHGDRVPAHVPAAVYQHLIVERGPEVVVGSMVEDWRAALAAAGRTGRVDVTRCAYVGLSMASRFGIPLAAELGPDLACAVFGKFGTRQGPGLPAGLNTPELMLDRAGRVSAPVLMHVQWDDELFPRAGGLELFDALAARDKVLVARPGRHADTHPDDERVWASFVTTHLPPAP